LSTYLGEDFLGKKRILSKEGAERIRKRIILMSVISMAIGALLTPLLVGFISAFYMPRDTFFQFVGILLVGKAVLLTKSVRSFHHHAIGTPRNRVFLILIYVTYLGVVFEVLRQTYAWTLSYVAQRQWLQLASDVSALVFGRAMAGVLLLGLLNAIFVSLITDRRLRRTNAGDK
jgi:MFS family permease